MRTPPLIKIGLVLASLLAFTATPAGATFHEMSIREIYPGSLAEPAAEYVELQMWAGGQNFVGGHTLRTYAANGSPTANLLTSDVPRGANQSTILIATPEAAALIPGTADGALSPSNQLDPAGGAVCWEAIDCVSWGGFSGTPSSATGTPAAAIPDGMALRRTISPGCATQLEPTDDRDSSAADFSPVFPSPRPNSVAPSERPCAVNDGGPAGSTGAGDQSGRGAPQTRLKHRPPPRTLDRTPTFRFGADESGSTFQCKLDDKPFRSCRSPFTTKKLSLGAHTFSVRARDDSGSLDKTPARCAFTVIAVRG